MQAALSLLVSLFVSLLDRQCVKREQEQEQEQDLVAAIGRVKERMGYRGENSFSFPSEK